VPRAARRGSRLAVVLLAFAAAFGLLAVRLAWLQVGDGPALAAAARSEHQHQLQLLPMRGDIVDRNGRLLAENEMAESLYALPPEVQDPAGEAATVARLTGLPVDAILKALTAKSHWVWVAHGLSQEQAAAVAAAKLPGLYFQQEPKRVYPNGALAGSVLGFTGTDGNGLAGVEYAFNKVLAGTPGDVVEDVDVYGRALPQAVQRYTPPRDGDTLQLTLDAGLQYQAEQALAETVATTRALWGLAVAMDPATGAILALANVPGFDPNRWSQYTPEQWRDPIVASDFQPGSSFKPVVAAAAIDAGLVSPTSRFADPNGWIRIGGATIWNWNLIGLGLPTLTQALEQSDNVVFAQVAQRLGAATFYQYLDRFGFNRPTGVDLPGEAAGLLPSQAGLRPLDLATMGFGQTLAVTPLQLLDAVAAIADGGTLMWPHIEAAVLDPRGHVLTRVAPRPLRRVVAPATAAAVTAMMVSVVENGLGKPAAVPGYWVAGKTGTAQIPAPGGGYVPDRYLVSFVGFAPADHPRLAVLVMVDQPQGPDAFGSTVAGPVFARIMAQGLHDLGVPPERPLPVATPTATATAGPGH
jgi:stage V sporulation protein D (sporulation-specific penicillin-binding protein)